MQPRRLVSETNAKVLPFLNAVAQQMILLQ